MTSSTSTKPLDLEAVERLRGDIRMRHWESPSPFKGFRLSHHHSFGPNDVGMDENQHIVRMPLLVGKPCFGQPAFYARNGGAKEKIDRRGVLRKTRCGNCPVFDACEKVSKRRLTATREIHDAFKRYKGEGGAVELEHSKEGDRVKSAYGALTRLLREHGDFTSVNDTKVVEHYDRKAVEALAKDAQRKAKLRREKIKAGLLDDDARELLDRHRRYRESQLSEALKQPLAGVHSSIAKLPIKSVEYTVDAWHARELLRAQNQKVNSSAVARLMIANWPKRYDGITRNTLRTRVDADLARADRLEYEVPNGRSAPIWPKFDLLKEIAEEANWTPYRA